MNSNNLRFERTKTMDIETKIDNKVFIKIPLESGGFWQKEYLQNDLIETVVKDFKAENQVEIPQDYFVDWNFKNKPLKMTDKIKTLLNQEIPTVCINHVIKKKPLLISNEDTIPDLVGKPFNDPFEVFLFAKDDKTLKIQTYDPTTVNNLFLNNYSPSSAYCNGNNHLFISGGQKKNGEIIDDFWEIDLKDQNIAEPVKIPKKKNHSMIYIPNNYVFVVGGNDKKTFYFNTENAEVCEWADLNKIRAEPALQRINNYLYCFDNINKGYNDIFTLEKTDLNTDRPEWILLTPRFNLPINEEQKLSQKFFGVSKDEEDNIIFLGGNMDNYNDNNEIYNYKYNTSLNTIELSKVPYRKYNFKEKTFLTYKKNIDYILPDFNKQHPEVVFFVKKNNKMEAIDYEPKINSQLKSLKPPMGDFKYDFNMPTVAIPDPLTDFDQQKITEQQNIFNTNMKMNINDPSFQDYNFKNQIENNDIKHDYINNKNKMELQTNFKEPEIEPMKEDVKLSMEINKDIFKSKEQINLRSNDPNLNNNINGINNPINELETIKQGKNKTFSVPLRSEINLFQEQPKNKNIQLNEIINSEYKINGIDINAPRIEGHDENIVIKGNKNIDSSLSGVISGTGAPKVDIKTVDNKIIDYTKNVNLTGTIQGIKSLNKNISKQNNNTKNNQPTIITGIIPGVKQTNAKVNVGYPNKNINQNVKLDLKGPKLDVNDNTINNNIGEIKVEDPKLNIESPNINLKGQNYHISGNPPNLNINQNVNIPSMNKKMPNYNLSGNIPGKKIIKKNVDVGVNLQNQINYNGNKDLPDVSISNPIIDIPSNKMEINVSKQKIPNYNLAGNIPGVKKNLNQDINISVGNQGNLQNTSNINMNNSRKIPDYNLYGNIPGKGVKNQKNVPSTNIKKNEPKPKTIIYSSGIIPGKKKVAPKIENSNLKNKVVVPNLNLSGNIPSMNANAPSVNLNPGNANIKEETKIIMPNYNISGNIPGVKKEEKKLNLQQPNLDINLNGPKIETNDIKMNANIENSDQLKINLPKVDPNPPKIELKSPKINVKENEINIPKIEMPNVSGNIILKDVKNQEPSEQGTIKLSEMNNSNININKPYASLNIKGNNISENNNTKPKNVNISGTIRGKKKVQAKIQNPNNNTNLSTSNINNDINRNSNIQLSTSQFQNSNIQPEISQIINVPRTEIKKQNENLEINPLIAEFEKGNINIQPQNLNKPLDYNISGNIPGVKVTKLNPSQQNKSFHIQGLIPSSKNTTNINYKINPNIEIPPYQINDNQAEPILFSKKNFHATINDPNNLDYSYNDLAASRNIALSQPPTNYYINSNSKINQNNNIKNKPNSINLVVTKMQIVPEKNLNFSNSQNIIQKSNNEYYPSVNSEMNYSYNINNNNRNTDLQKSNNDYTIKNNIENKPQIKNNDNQEQYIINGDDINVEIPKIDAKLNNNITEITKIESQYKNNNKIEDKDNHKLTDLRFKSIKEESGEINNIVFDEENVNSGSNRGITKKKNKDLPLVGEKNNNFKSSKIGVVGNLYTENIDINNLKSNNVGVNGIKIGDRIIE